MYMYNVVLIIICSNFFFGEIEW